MRAIFTCVPTPAPPSVALADTENILLLGSDLRAGDRLWHTDTMILVAIDHQNNQVGVLSFPRDYWLYIPGYYRTDGSQFDRINVVDYVGERVMKAPGGRFGMLQDVFEYNFGIRLDRFIRLHRQGFVDIVDSWAASISTLTVSYGISPDPRWRVNWRCVAYPPAGRSSGWRDGA